MAIQLEAPLAPDVSCHDGHGYSWDDVLRLLEVNPWHLPKNLPFRSCRLSCAESFMFLELLMVRHFFEAVEDSLGKLCRL